VTGKRGPTGKKSSRAQVAKLKDPYEGTPWPTLSIVIAIVAVSFASILIRWSGAHPLTMAFYRMLFTLALLAPFAWKDVQSDLKECPMSRKEAGQLFAVGFVLACHFALWITSLELTTVASSVLLVTFHPVFVSLVGYYLLKERLSRLNIVGMVVALVGAMVLVYGDFTKGDGGSLTGATLIGDVLAFLGGIAAGIYILAGRYFRRTRGLMTYVLVVYSGSAICLFIMCLIARAPFVYPPKEFLLFFLMALGPGIFGHTIYNWALKYVKATLVSVSLLGEPIGASLLAFFLLKEVPGSLTMVGGVAILIGIYLTASGLSRQEEGQGRKGNI
jgi:drug/metabolite transporter (DMT)-like permease